MYKKFKLANPTEWGTEASVGASVLILSSSLAIA